jgi:hypothetical protein
VDGEAGREVVRVLDLVWDQIGRGAEQGLPLPGVTR